jgi:hypothetical protein
MREIAEAEPEAPAPTEDDLPVEAMRYSVAEHYEEFADSIPIEDGRQFDIDLRQVFVRGSDAPQGEPAELFLRRHYREIVSRISFWTSEPPSVVQSLVDMIARRAEALGLRVGALEAATLIELTSFATAVVMMYRYTHVIGRARNGATGAMR